MFDMWKWCIYIGLCLILVGALLYLGSKLGISFGKLPGDIHKGSFSFPIVTCLIVSVVLTLVINFLLWIFRK